MIKQDHRVPAALAILTMLLFVLVACSSLKAKATPGKVEHETGHEREMPELFPVSLGAGEKLKVVASTSIVGDVIKNVGGDEIDLTVLVPVGTDPHSFEPTPQDVAAVADAHVVFVNGAGLEESLEPLLESAEAVDKVVAMSLGLELIALEGEHEHEGHKGDDPHTWTDPNFVIAWTHIIESALSELDPANADVYEANAEAYETALEELDAWIREQVASIAESDRRIVTDHSLFGYFAARYGFTQVGTIVPGYSTLAEPSAKELADLEDAIKDLGVKAIFVGNTVNPNLAQRVAQDTGTQLVFIYTGSLSEKGGPADSYVDYIRYNVQAFVNALK